MSVVYCEKCGTELNEIVNFCSSCGQALRKENKEIKSENRPSKTSILNIVGLIVILLFSYQFYMQWYMYGFKWNMTTTVVQNSMNDSSMVLLVLTFVAYLLFIIIFSIYYKETFLSQMVVKVTFLPSLISVVTFSLHFLYTLLIYLHIRKGIEVVLGYYNEQSADYVRNILSFQMTILLIALFAVVGFICIVLKRYFRKQSVSFLEGFKFLTNKPFSLTKLVDVFKQLD